MSLTALRSSGPTPSQRPPRRRHRTTASAFLFPLVAAVACAPVDSGQPFAGAPLALTEPAADLASPRASRPTSLRIFVGGDLLPHRPMLETPERVHAALAPIASLLAEPDIAVANYETATGSPTIFGHGKSISLAVSPEWMGEIGTLFHAVTVANNHACDLGRSGLDETLATAKRLDVIALGGDENDPWHARVLAEKDGHRVCAVAWTTFVNARGPGCSGSGKLAVAPFDRKGRARIERAVMRARAGGCDAVVAILHGGKEYEPQIWGPRSQARVAAEAGADAIVIHHPHVPSPVDVLTTRDGRKVPVFESVGNLVSNQGESYKMPMYPVSQKRLISLNAWTRLGVLADLSWTWPAETGAAPAHPTLSYAYHLLWTENDHAFDRKNPLPHITVRSLDPVADRPLIDRLLCDERGPKRIFSDACWFEATGKRCDVGVAGLDPAVGL